MKQEINIRLELLKLAIKNAKPGYYGNTDFTSVKEALDKLEKMYNELNIK